MMRRSLLLGVSLWSATTVTAYSEIYSWTDDQGTVHFTEDAAAVPSKFRSKALRAEDNGAPGAETAPAPQAAEGEVKTPGASGEGAAKAAELFDFKTRDQWQEELRNQEAVMVELRHSLDELAAAAGKIPARTAEKEKLVADHQALRAKYNAMKARYFRLVEAARKAGFQVDLQQ